MLVRSRLIALKFCYMCRQTVKEKRGSPLYHRIVRSITAWLHIFIDYSYYFYSSERRQTLCTLNLLNLTMKLTLQSHQTHPNMSPRYMLMLKKCLLSYLVERIQTAYSQRTRILKRLASKWKKKCNKFMLR